MVDYLRSCYSTDMVLRKDGVRSQIVWYFALPGAPLVPYNHSLHSLNWSRPDYGQGQIGEVIGAPRPWRDGSYPDFIGQPSPSYSMAGLPQDWRDGAPLTYGPTIVTYTGQKGFPYVPRAAGIFPTFYQESFIPPVLSTNIGGPFGPATWIFDRWVWSQGFPTFVQGAWLAAANQGRLYPCVGGSVLRCHFGVNDHVMRCLTYDTATEVSTWDDPAGGILLPGEVWTLRGLG